MTNQEFQTLTYTTRPKTAKRTAFQVWALVFGIGNVMKQSRWSVWSSRVPLIWMYCFRMNSKLLSPPDQEQQKWINIPILTTSVRQKMVRQEKPGMAMWELFTCIWIVVFIVYLPHKTCNHIPVCLFDFFRFFTLPKVKTKESQSSSG